MIGQYLPQTNESATVPKTFQFSELNKALDGKLKSFREMEYLVIHLRQSLFIYASF